MTECLCNRHATFNGMVSQETQLCESPCLDWTGLHAAWVPSICSPALQHADSLCHLASQRVWALMLSAAVAWMPLQHKLGVKGGAR